MRRTHLRALTALALLATSGLACDSDPAEPRPDLPRWSEPQNLGAPINTPLIESSPTLSPDGLTLYFDSDRTDLPGGQGARDVWYARRDCVTCAWQTPVNLGADFNTPYVDGSPALSTDGRLLFFMTHGPRADCHAPVTQCDAHILVTRRDDPTDDAGWGPPESVGPEVNTELQDNEPGYTTENGQPVLYFFRGSSFADYDIYRAPIDAKGVATGAAERVAELSTGGMMDGGPTLSADGLEAYFYAEPARGGLGSFDLWRSARSSTADAWGPPVNAGAPLNTTARDMTPSLSADGSLLLFASDRQGPDGNRDIYIAERLPDD